MHRIDNRYYFTGKDFEIIIKDDSFEVWTETKLDYFSGAKSPKAWQEVLVKDYDIIFNTLNSQKIVNIRDNYLRYNKIEVNLEEVCEIRIDILQTHGGDKVHMYGIKVLN